MRLASDGGSCNNPGRLLQDGNPALRRNGRGSICLGTCCCDSRPRLSHPVSAGTVHIVKMYGTFALAGKYAVLVKHGEKENSHALYRTRLPKPLLADVATARNHPRLHAQQVQVLHDVQGREVRCGPDAGHRAGFARAGCHCAGCAHHPAAQRQPAGASLRQDGAHLGKDKRVPAPDGTRLHGGPRNGRAQQDRRPAAGAEGPRLERGVAGCGERRRLDACAHRQGLRLGGHSGAVPQARGGRHRLLDDVPERRRRPRA